jgi:hypothetical protein
MDDVGLGRRKEAVGVPLACPFSDQKEWLRFDRIVLGIYIHDAELAKLHHHEATLRPSIERLPLPSSNELFSAPNATVWKNLILQDQVKHLAASRPQQPPSPSPIDLGPMRLPEVSNNFGLCAMLESISAIACESHEAASFAPDTAQKCQRLLMLWYETYRPSLIAGKDGAFPLMILWHSIFVNLHANLDVLECACGREGHDVSQEALGYAQKWATSSDAKRCLLHAICIRRNFESMSIGAESPIHIPTCLYQCGMIWFCFGQFGTAGGLTAAAAHDPLHFPELQLLGIDSNRIFREEIGNSQRGRPVPNQVFKIVDLLQRIFRWKLSRNLASTLLALVEEQQDIF